MATNLEDALTSRLLGILMHAAMKGETIVYSPCANLVGLRMKSQYHRALFGQYLAEVGELSLATWGIVLPVLVVGKNDELPSGRYDPENPSGFWSWAVEHGYDISDPEALAEKLQGLCFEKLAELANEGLKAPAVG